MNTVFLNIDRLATVSEINFLLKETLYNEPISWHDLSVLCKERSFNFALAFENTIRFLQGISILSIDTDKSINISYAELYHIKNDEDLSTFLFQRVCDHIEKKDSIRTVFSDETVSNNGEDLVILTQKLSHNFVFIKSFLLNIKIARPIKSFDQLLILQGFADILRNKLFLKKNAEKQSNSDQKKVSQKTRLYISYSQKDRDYMVKLKDHFSGLILNEIIESHDDGCILPGDDWDKRNREMLERSQVILFLVSSHLMTSEYIINVEMPIALDRHKKGEVKIIPVIIRPCDYKSLPIGKFQAVPVGEKAISTWPNPDEAFLNVVDQIKRIL